MNPRSLRWLAAPKFGRYWRADRSPLCRVLLASVIAEDDEDAIRDVSDRDATGELGRDLDNTTDTNSRWREYAVVVGDSGTS